MRLLRHVPVTDLNSDYQLPVHLAQGHGRLSTTQDHYGEWNSSYKESRTSSRFISPLQIGSPSGISFTSEYATPATRFDGLDSAVGMASISSEDMNMVANLQLESGFRIIEDKSNSKAKQR